MMVYALVTTESEGAIALSVRRENAERMLAERLRTSRAGATS
jgi:hypothetical protein